MIEKKKNENASHQRHLTKSICSEEWADLIYIQTLHPDYPSGTAKVLFEERQKPPVDDDTVDPPVPLPLNQAQKRALKRRIKKNGTRRMMTFVFPP